MRQFAKHTDFWKGIVLATIVIGAIAAPYTFSLQTKDIHLKRAEAALGLPYFCGVTSGSPHRCTLNDVSAGCNQTDPTKCTDTDQTVLQIIAGCANNASFFSWQGASYGCSDGQIQQADQANKLYQATVTSCTASMTNWSPVFNPICWGRTIGAIVGGFLVSMASWLLTVAGMLFNWVLNITVVQFGQFMTNTVLQGITTAWTAFRDISNIVIIGIFTFIAISIILGIKEFNQKRLIANVLIIAVLINFSLLFTKMVIDASNFTATQFYNAALTQTAGTGTNSTNQLGISGCDGSANAKCYGIAGAFMDYAGVSGFGDTKAAVSQLAEKFDNGVTAFLFAVATATLFVIAALVLFYGSFILISRGILFIFLMVTSALAFVSYIVPVWDKSSYGFGAWRKSLIGNAALAPLLMLFLWMTLNVGNAMKQGQKGGTLGDLIANPTKVLDISALFNYIVVLGLLFVSFRLSSSLANKISGFDWASMATVLPFTLGSRALGFGLRQTAGWAGYFSDKNLTGQARDARDRAGRARLLEEQALAEKKFGRATKLGNIARKFENLSASKEQQAALARKVSGSRMNLMNTKAAQAVLGAVGIKGFATGESARGAKSYADQIKARAEAAEKAAAKIAPSKEQNEEAKQRVREERRGRREQLEATKKVAEETAKRDRGPIEELIKVSKDNQRGAEIEREKNQKIHDVELQQAREEARRADANYDGDHRMIEGDEEEKRDINARFTGAAREIQLQAQAQRIENARNSIHNYETGNNSTEAAVIRGLQSVQARDYERDSTAVNNAAHEIGEYEKRLTSINQSVKDATKDLEEFDKKTEGLGDAMVAAIGKSAEKIAEKIGTKQGPPAARFLGQFTGANAEVGAQAKALYKKKIKTADLAAVVADLKDDTPKP